MALVPESSPFHGLSGKLGEFMFRTRNGKTFMSPLPVYRKRKPSELQKRNKERFAEMARNKRKK